MHTNVFWTILQQKKIAHLSMLILVVDLQYLGFYPCSAAFFCFNRINAGVFFTFLSVSLDPKSVTRTWRLAKLCDFHRKFTKL